MSLFCVYRIVRAYYGFASVIPKRFSAHRRPTLKGLRAEFGRLEAPRGFTSVREQSAFPWATFPKHADQCRCSGMLRVLINGATYRRAGGKQGCGSLVKHIKMTQRSDDKTPGERSACKYESGQTCVATVERVTSCRQTWRCD